MCQLCKGTHVIHEVSSYSIRTSCCPECGAESDEIWRSRLEALISDIRSKKEAVASEFK